MKLFAFLLLCSVAFAGCKSEQPQPHAQLPETALQFDVDQALVHLDELTQDRYTGRMAGTEGNMLAAEYLADTFGELGLQSFGEDGFYQWYNQNTIASTIAELELLNSDGRIERTFKCRQDFLPVNRSSGLSVDLTDPWMLVGAETNLAGVNLDSKVVLWDRMHDTIHSETAFSQAKLVLYSRERTGGYGNGPVPLFLTSTRFRETPTDMVAISPETFLYLSGLTGKGYELRAKLKVEQVAVRVPNVLGLLPAPEQTEQTVIIAAHFDHMGTDPDGSINRGASDNAAGVALMTELARVLADQRDSLTCNVVFAAFNGEEHGLLGSSYFVEQLKVDKDKCRIIVLDVVACRDSRLVAQGALSRATLWDEIKALADDTGMTLTAVDDTGRSDHAPFIRAGYNNVVWLMHFSQGYFDRYYHTPEDTLDIIDSELLSSLGQLLTNYLELYCLTGG